ncbi:MAG: TetR/AcrR family transcriptional regulator [Phycisphaerales bacterium]|nr:TetR/AcrR family transcriptional regulator [Phycisphaerales bacterium]
MPWEKSFNRGEALTLAEHKFWEAGYAATSMDSLLESMGIQKGSFYATFGSKHQVYVEALEHYIAERFKQFDSSLSAGSPRKALLDHCEAVLSESLRRRSNRGCFLVNAALELSPQDPEVRRVIERALDRHRMFYVTALRMARERGEVAPDLDPEQTASSMLGMVLGIRVMARQGIPSSVIQQVADGLCSLIPAR